MNLLFPLNRLFPPSPVWRELYAAAANINKLAPWEWMYDADIFGVQNPVNGEIAYCCILGGLGEVFGLVAYLGTEGLESYYKLSEQKEPVFELFCHQKCLSITFDRRESLVKQELKLIKELELKFHGRNAWPVFRSYLPGYFPWYFTVEEAEFFTLILQQAAQVAERFLHDPDLLDPRRANYYFVRVPEKAGNDLIWQDAYLKPEPLARKRLSGGRVDEKRLQELKSKLKIRGAWEADYFYAPLPARESKGPEKPFFPILMFFIDHNSSLIFHNNITSMENMVGDFRAAVLDAMEKTKAIPKEILVIKKEAREILEPVAAKLKIRLKLVKKLRNVSEVKSVFYNFLEGGGLPGEIEDLRNGEDEEAPPKKKGRDKLRP